MNTCVPLMYLVLVEDIRAPGIGVVDSCELPYGGKGTQVLCENSQLDKNHFVSPYLVFLVTTLFLSTYFPCLPIKQTMPQAIFV